MAKSKFKVIAPDGKPENHIIVVPPENIEMEGRLMLDFIIAMLRGGGDNAQTWKIVNTAEELAESAVARMRVRGWLTEVPAPWEAKVGQTGGGDVG